jgi:TRAP-type uncharacterized transport system fused permease subunit
MFIFYFAIASAITPPIALAAFAASTITKADPMATGFSAVKSGIVMFVIPFIFAFYPEILLIEQAQIDPAASAKGMISFLPGYDGTTNWLALLILLTRVVLALYLIASALAGFDQRKLSGWEIVGRFGIAIVVLFFSPAFYLTGCFAATLLLIWHTFHAK